MDFSRLKDINQSKVEQADKQVDKTMQELASLRTQEVFVKAIQSLANLIATHTTRTVVENQIQGFATTKDAQQLGVSLQALLDELKTHENTDVSPVVNALNEAVTELKAIPKEKVEIEIPEQVDYTEQFKDLIDETKGVLQAIKSQKTTVEAPIVNVDAPTVNVDAPDLKPLGKDLAKSFKDAVKAIVIPQPKDYTKVLKDQLAEQKKTNRILEELPTGSSSGSGSIAPFLDNGQLPVVNASLDLQVDDTGTYTYLGNATPGTATSASGWRIKRVVNATGVITHADGVSTFNKEWDERASYSY